MAKFTTTYKGSDFNTLLTAYAIDRMAVDPVFDKEVTKAMERNDDLKCKHHDGVEDPIIDHFDGAGGQ